MPIVYRYVAERLGGRADAAEDVVQETFALAVERIDQFDATRGDLRQWVLGIARNRVVDHFRRAGRIIPQGGLGLDCPNALDQTPLPDEVVEEAELRASVRMALGQLRESHRQVLLDRYEEQLSLEQIGARRERKPEAVESLLLEIRLGSREYTPGFTKMTMARRGREWPIYVSPESAPSSGDFQTVEALAPSGRSDRQWVMVRMTPDGATKLALLTRANINRPLAVLLDGRPVSAPVIKAEFKESIVLSLDEMSRQEAISIAERIKTASN